MKKSFLYSLSGFTLGLGAPIGALLLKFLFHPSPWVSFASEEWAHYSFYYIYMTVGTCTVFALFGYNLGQKADILSNQNKVFSSEAQTDPLTGLGNHRFLHEAFNAEFRKHLDNRQPISCLMMDLDFFKRINDSHGHPFGDVILKLFARIIEECVRQGDIATRYGGEEFLCILPNCDEDNARMVAERIRSGMEKELFRDGPYEVKVTVSIGVTTVRDPLRAGYRAMIEEADRDLYEAKQRGRNQVVQTTLGGGSGLSKDKG